MRQYHFFQFAGEQASLSYDLTSKTPIYQENSGVSLHHVLGLRSSHSTSWLCLIPKNLENGVVYFIDQTLLFQVSCIAVCNNTCSWIAETRSVACLSEICSKGPLVRPQKVIARGSDKFEPTDTSRGFIGSVESVHFFIMGLLAAC
jgi:hypothetical protein